MFAEVDCSSTLNDLPPRTWSGWWHSWPKWFRIGFWAALVMVLVHVALAIRIYLGLFELPEITALRNRGAEIEYSWEDGLELFAHHHTLLAGLYGRRWHNVVEIRLNDLATDADVAHIANHCPSLKRLYLNHADILTDTIGELRRCRRLQELDLRETDTNDTAVAGFSGLQELSALYLTGTLVTDRSIPILKTLPKLTWVDLYYTDVTIGSLKTWRAERANAMLMIATERDHYAEPELGVICWSDGQRSSGFHGTFHVSLEGPLNSKKKGHRQASGAMLTRSQQWWLPREFTSRGDGEYRLKLKLGEYDAEPMILTVKDQTLPARQIEFRMPCTKAEALRSTHK